MDLWFSGLSIVGVPMQRGLFSCHISVGVPQARWWICEEEICLATDGKSRGEIVSPTRCLKWPNLSDWWIVEQDSGLGSYTLGLRVVSGCTRGSDVLLISYSAKKCLQMGPTNKWTNSPPIVAGLTRMGIYLYIYIYITSPFGEIWWVWPPWWLEMIPWSPQVWGWGFFFSGEGMQLLPSSRERSDGWTTPSQLACLYVGTRIQRAFYVKCITPSLPGFGSFWKSGIHWTWHRQQAWQTCVEADTRAHTHTPWPAQ